MWTQQVRGKFHYPSKLDFFFFFFLIETTYSNSMAESKATNAIQPLCVLTDRDSCGEDEGEDSFSTSGDAAEEAVSEMPRRRLGEPRRRRCSGGWGRDGREKRGAKAVEAWSKQADDAIVVVFVPWDSIERAGLQMCSKRGVCVAVEERWRERSAGLLVTNHGTPLTWAKLNLTFSRPWLWPMGVWELRSVPVNFYDLFSNWTRLLKKGWPWFLVFFIDYQYICRLKVLERFRLILMFGPLFFFFSIIYYSEIEKIKIVKQCYICTFISIENKI